jgi:hypothetical protein
MAFIEIIRGPGELFSYNLLLSKKEDIITTAPNVVPVPDMEFRRFKFCIEKFFQNDKTFKLSLDEERQESLIIEIATTFEDLKERLQTFFAPFLNNAKKLPDIESATW